MPTCRVEIPPIKAYVKETFLYDMDPQKTELLPCFLYGVTSYPGYTLTFDIWLRDTGGTFAFMPLHALQATREKPSVTLDLEDLTCRNCPDPEIAVSSSEFLKEKPVYAYLKRRNLWMLAEYILSVDWYKENELVNIVRLENGQFAALPNHRLLFGKKLDKLPDYKKTHGAWRV